MMELTPETKEELGKTPTLYLVDHDYQNPETPAISKEKAKKKKASTPKSPKNDGKRSSPSRKGKSGVIKKEKTHMCQVCDKCFARPFELTRHVRIHTGEKPFKCTQCEKAFIQKVTLEAHYNAIHNKTKPYTCEICSMTFSNMGNLRAHRKNMHTPSISKGEQKFPCAECPCAFRKLCALTAHVAKVHAKPLQIQVEDGLEENLDKVSSPSESGKENEIATKRKLLDGTDVKEVDFSYEEFGKLRKIKLLLKEDVRGRRTNVCSTCLKEFRKPSDMIRHMKTHTKERPYKCNMCTKSFSLKSTLKSHQDRAHVRRKCKHCDETFSKLGAFRDHLLKAHGENPGRKRYPCSQCSAVFKKSTHLNQHVLRHTGEKPYQCFLCIGRFSTGGALNSHIKSHIGVQEHKCHLCSLSFTASGSFRRHLARHSDEPPQSCPNCYKRYRNKRYFKRHMLHCSKTSSDNKEISETVKDSKSLLPESQTEQQNIEPEESAEPQQLDINDNDEGNDTSEPISLPHSPDNEITKCESMPPKAESVLTITPEGPFLMLVQGATEESSQSTEAVNPRTSQEIECHASEFQSDFIIESEPETKAESASEPSNVKAEKKLKTNGNRCHLCNKIFKKSSDLVRHVRIHTGEKPFQCSTCGRRFRVKSTCIAHMRIHSSSSKTVACTICKNQFATMSSLKLHMRLHTGIRPFKCTECSRDFRTAGHLQAHKKTHLRQISQPVPKRIELPSPIENEHANALLSFASNVNFANSQLYQSDTTFIPIPTVQLQNPQSQSSSTPNDFEAFQPDNITSLRLSSSENECLKLIGSLELSLENLQNIQITSVDLSNIQVDDLFQNLIIVNAPVAVSTSFQDETAAATGTTVDSFINCAINIPSNLPEAQTIPLSGILQNGVEIHDSTSEFLQLGGSSLTSFQGYGPVSTLDPFLTVASVAAIDESSHVAPSSTFSVQHDIDDHDGDGSETKDKLVNSKQCPDCGRMFSKPSQMLRHQLVHTGEKPHVCTICKNTFSQKSSLDTHVMFTHSEVRPYQCPQCPFKTVQRAALKKHCSRAHPELDFNAVLELLDQSKK